MSSVSSPTEVYWVEAGVNGYGSESNPAGNITYILTNNASANDVINVKLGVYNTTIGETFPLNITNYENVTLEATGTPADTIINGTGTTSGIKITTDENTITGFTIKNFVDEQDAEAGIRIYSGSSNTVTGNTFTPSGYGIYLASASNNNIISSNNITTYIGIISGEASENTIIGNILHNNIAGIWLYNSVDNVIYDNVMKQCGIFLRNDRATLTTQLIDENNTVNGKPVYYYANQDMQGASVPSDAGQVILGNVTGLTIEDVHVNGTFVGILLGYSSHITMRGNIVTDNNAYGILLDGSSENTITGNIITGNDWIGIWLGGSSTSNLVYRNKVVGNGVNARDTYGGNAFNTTIGNYWGDYNGTDANGDGIGDMPYEIPGGAGSKDYRPAMTPFALPPSPEEPKPQPQGISPFFFVISLMIPAIGVVFGLLLVRCVDNPVLLWMYMHHTRLKTVITTITTYLRHLLTEDDLREAPSVQRTLAATAEELGTRLEEPVREEDKPELVNLVRDAFYLLGKRFGVTWKDAWTVKEFMSRLIERAGSPYENLLGEGYRHYEELLYAERAEWREAFQAIHNVLVKMTEKLRENPSSPMER